MYEVLQMKALQSCTGNLRCCWYSVRSTFADSLFPYGSRYIAWKRYCYRVTNHIWKDQQFLICNICARDIFFQHIAIENKCKLDSDSSQSCKLRRSIACWIHFSCLHDDPEVVEARLVHLKRNNCRELSISRAPYFQSRYELGAKGRVDSITWQLWPMSTRLMSFVQDTFSLWKCEIVKHPMILATLEHESPLWEVNTTCQSMVATLDVECFYTHWVSSIFCNISRNRHVKLPLNMTCEADEVECILIT